MTAATREKPKRIQRRRTKGWRMPPGAIYVGRPTVFGNPFTTADEFRRWLAGKLRGSGNGIRRAALFARLPELRNRDLACWCKLCDRHQDGLPLGETCPDCEPCHVDPLLELANGRDGG